MDNRTALCLFTFGVEELHEGVQGHAAYGAQFGGNVSGCEVQHIDP